MCGTNDIRAKQGVRNTTKYVSEISMKNQKQIEQITHKNKQNEILNYLSNQKYIK